MSGDTIGRVQFAMVPCWVYGRVTNATALRLYVILSGKYANGKRQAFPTIKTLAADLELQERSVMRLIKILEAARVIEVTRTRTDAMNSKNYYWLPMDDPDRVTQMSPGADQQERSDRVTFDDIASAGPGDSNVTQNHTYNLNQPEKSKDSVTADATTDHDEPQADLFGQLLSCSEQDLGSSDLAGNARSGQNSADVGVNPSPTPPRDRQRAQRAGADDRAELDALWLEFWQVYPRKTAKIEARKAWDKAVRSADAREIINGATRYAQQQAPPDRKPYTRYPASWLNGGCWDDDPAPPSVNGNGRRAEQGPYRNTTDVSLYEEALR